MKNLDLSRTVQIDRNSGCCSCVTFSTCMRRCSPHCFLLIVDHCSLVLADVVCDSIEQKEHLRFQFIESWVDRDSLLGKAVFVPLSISFDSTFDQSFDVTT
ncbi:hypothetical protein BLNAU_8498 [Blattamonas nauphoetae]|uniref:Uncharacterized protein n=1 Tax=Blattamonas nauphoetae TaxID=2049346 RepID=A0ABQ9XYA1_9EUKA|nr:hypothetical protein BLNAU_8498 [Blattamonas nauphoetae]